MNAQKLNAIFRRLEKENAYSIYMAAENILEQMAPGESDLRSLKIAILRNFTFDPLVPVIKGETARAGLYPEIYMGDYDTIAQNVFDAHSPLYEFQPDLVIVAQWLDAMAPELTDRFPSLSPDRVNSEVERVLKTIDEFIAALRRRTDVPLLINNFPLPTYPSVGILDGQSENYQTNMILKLNREMLGRLRRAKNVYLVDYMSLMARIGGERGIDERYWQVGRAPIGRNALVQFGQEYGKFIRALYGKARKCLVLDCDNILWGGVIGEDGLGGIRLGANYPGSCYQAFQQEVLNLHDRGVILALCSKNNEADVLEVLHSHPEMLLREEHFSTWQINWNDKATNLKRIAEYLNIGLDSIVFVDDNQFECDLVREQLPQVAVLQLSSEPSSFKTKLCGKAYFDMLSFSVEDRARNRMYRDQVKRKQLQASAVSLDDYLTKLDMEVEIGLADELSIQRISQLTQKTNQFNLTTRRYTEGDIRTFAESPEADVFYLKLRDRISEMGLIGAAILKYEDDLAEIDTFLLSCRAIGRGVEKALLAYVLNFAKSRGFCFARGRYLSTKKNEQVADFYQRYGFSLLAKSDLGSDWQLALDDKAFLGPSWIMMKTVGQEEKVCK